MRVLLDHNVDRKFARLLPEHEVSHAYKMGWAGLVNGQLIAAADREGFDVMITADKSMQHQQTIATRKTCIIVLNSLFITWPHIEPLAPQVRKLLAAGIRPGAFHTIDPEGSALP